MIMDRLEKLVEYIPDQYREGVSAFLDMVSDDMEEKTYEIYGTHVFAKVMSYPTKEPMDCKIEAHNRYIDIQATISGAEGIDLFKRVELKEQVSYNEANDVAFYVEDNEQAFASNRNIPGYFSMIFPEEAHRPQERVEGCDNFVKKFVIKLEVGNESV